MFSPVAFSTLELDIQIFLQSRSEVPVIYVKDWNHLLEAASALLQRHICAFLFSVHVHSCIPLFLHFL